MSTIDEADVQNFERQAHQWWDETGPFKPLHQINPHRIAFIKDEICRHFNLKTHENVKPLEPISILDIGCGGGLVCEPLSRLGATIKGIDAGKANIQVAQDHADQQNLKIHYEHTTAEDLATSDQKFDVVIALEIVEHVSDMALFLKSCTDLIKPGGLLIMSTLNRTVKSFLFGIVAAEYVLRWVPRGTHNWQQFVEPAELAFHLEDFGTQLKSLKGLEYNPLKRSWYLSDNTDVNYFLSAEKIK